MKQLNFPSDHFQFRELVDGRRGGISFSINRGGIQPSIVNRLNGTSSSSLSLLISTSIISRVMCGVMKSGRHRCVHARPLKCLKKKKKERIINRPLWHHCLERRRRRQEGTSATVTSQRAPDDNNNNKKWTSPPWWMGNITTKKS